MTKRTKVVLILTGLLALGSCGYIVKMGIEANDLIDICADNLSPRYIENEVERSARCKEFYSN